MTLPNYLVIGASKCGTSSLCLALGRHPDVFMSTPKEPNFFCYDHVYAKGMDWYERLFDGAGQRRAVGEGTTQYSQRAVFPECAPRIARHLPDAKLIYIVRHPLDRIKSLWTQLLEQRYPVSHDINAAVRQDVARFVESSNYLREIACFRDRYPDDRILVVFFEDFRKDASAVLERCFAFLGVDPTFRPPDADEPTNRSDAKRVEASWLKSMRRSPGYAAVSRLVPGPLKRRLREITRVAPPRMEFDPQTRRWLVEQLAGDTSAFLESHGKPENYWPMEVEVRGGASAR